MKKVLVVATALAIALSAGAVVAKVNCTVDSVEGDKVTMTCKNVDDLAAGDSVTVKKKKAKALEGC
ncbi:MAG: hypothetical protein OEV64_05185 [Desulfobulbaceae bacterium]|nr:hypothetical protein [Desulfobulbaceae bacterium]